MRVALVSFLVINYALGTHTIVTPSRGNECKGVKVLGRRGTNQDT